MLKYLERRFYGQTVYIENSGGMNHFICIIRLIDANDYAERIIRSLQDRIDDTAIVLFPVIAGDDIKAVTDLKQCGLVDLSFCHAGGSR